jgi:hypothetical protein
MNSNPAPTVSDQKAQSGEIPDHGNSTDPPIEIHIEDAPQALVPSASDPALPVPASVAAPAGAADGTQATPTRVQSQVAKIESRIDIKHANATKSHPYIAPAPPAPTYQKEEDEPMEPLSPFPDENDDNNDEGGQESLFQKRKYASEMTGTLLSNLANVAQKLEEVTPKRFQPQPLPQPAYAPLHQGPRPQQGPPQETGPRQQRPQPQPAPVARPQQASKPQPTPQPVMKKAPRPVQKKHSLTNHISHSFYLTERETVSCERSGRPPIRSSI